MAAGAGHHRSHGLRGAVGSSLPWTPSVTDRWDLCFPVRESDHHTGNSISKGIVLGVSPSLKKVFRKAGYKVAFKANPNLMSILTKKNKVKLPPNSYPGVYKIPCPCGVPPYIGKTKLRTNTRINQHKEYVNKEHWERSGAAQHARTCPTGPSFEEATTLKTEHRHFERSVREALEIQRHRSAPRFEGINQDEGQYLNTTFWMPYMDTVSKEEKERNQRRLRGNDQQMISDNSSGNTAATAANMTSNNEDTPRNP